MKLSPASLVFSLGLAATAVVGTLTGCGTAMAQMAQLSPLTAQGARAMAATARGTAETADDAVKRGILAGGEPRTIFEVRRKLKAYGGAFKTHIVSNRGHENPEAGSFSFFETYAGPVPGGQVQEGELFIGYFTERQGDTLQVMQGFEPGLMVELIAWDRTKQMFNFWELIGNGKSSEWHYRGDSRDVLDDVARINVGAASPSFGATLRCSGCHTLGGPIMKELDGPHNDWWTAARKLDLGTMKLKPGADAADPANVAADLFAHATDADHLAGLVRQGVDRLQAARAARGGDGQSLKQRLRPLFSTMEMNLVSDRLPFRERVGGAVELPRAFFVDPRLAGAGAGVPVDAARYADALRQAGSRFAPDEANLPETRHAFVVPARSYMDNAALDALVRQGLLDEELIADVLAVDLTTPVFSKARAGLLKYVPEGAGSAAELKAGLAANLAKAPEDAAARELLRNLTEPARTAAAHRRRAASYLAACTGAASDQATVSDWLRIASQRRAELRAAETSRNPRGQITEPGFRVIFPVDTLNPTPGALRLSEATGRLDQPVARAAR